MDLQDVLNRTNLDKPRKTKIVATIGPASRDEAMIESLILAGVNVFRLNFSHGTHEEHFENLSRIRKISLKLKKDVAVLQDLAGPKIRITQIDDTKVLLKDGELVNLEFSEGQISSNETIFVEGVDPVTSVKVKDRVLLADGIMELIVDSIQGKKVSCKIVKGGKLRSRIGISFPDSDIDLPAATEKDLIDFDWALKNEVDFVALSFVSSKKDILILKDRMKDSRYKPGIIAKIERKVALHNIKELVQVSDGIMVARGDLGLELLPEQVPLVQRELIEISNHAGIPVIIATQMLSSMVTAIRPTRAEVSDVANAVMAGADAVMLSEESAIGDHPIKCVEFLDRIAKESERSFAFEEYRFRLRDSDRESVPDAIAYAACAAAVKVKAQALICCTETGNSARLLAKYRPQQPLYGAAVKDAARRRMCLFWGVTPIQYPSTKSHYDEIDAALSAVKEREGLRSGSLAVVTSGLTVGNPGSTSVIEIRSIS
jgi:pyruvate kinase